MIGCREQLAEVTEKKITDHLKEDIVTTQRRNGLNGHLKWNRFPGKKQKETVAMMARFYVLTVVVVT